MINQIFEDTNEVQKTLYNTHQSENVSNCFALTIKKDYKITVFKNAVSKGKKIFWKVALSIITINFLNSFL